MNVTTAEPSLRERKKAKTRDALVEAAYDLFRRKGFEQTTVDEIAEVADVSRRTFFRYFATKEAVVFPDQAKRLRAFREMLARKDPDEPPFQAVRRACLAIAEDYSINRRAMLAQQRLIDASPALLAYERDLDWQWERAIAEALLERGVSGEGEQRARILAGAAIGAIRAALREWFADDARGDLFALGERTFGYLERGFNDHSE